MDHIMRALRALVCLALVLIVGAAVAGADTLHGYCVAPASPCSDNGTITPTGNNPPYFAFSYSGNLNNGHGDFWLVDLVPDNENAGFSLTLNGTNTTNSPVGASLFSSTEWNSGKLSDYLNTFTFGPSHPLSAFLPSTQTVDPGANGYYVYLLDFGAFDYKTAPGDPSFSVNSGAVPQGSVFLAFLTDYGTKNVTVDTPNSAAILETSPPPGSPTPEPSSILLLGSGVLGFAAMLRRRMKI
jgi:PEP-CTERM motif